MDVRISRAASPGFAAGREFDVDASLGASAVAGAAARCLTAEQVHRIGALEQFRMVLHPLAQADVHALLVAFGNDDQIHRQLSVHGLDRAERVELRHLRAFRVCRAAPDQHLLVGPLLDETRFERRVVPRVGLRDRHGVVHPVDEERLLGALVTLGVNDGIARRAVFSHAHVKDLCLLAAELVEEGLDHLRRLRDALTGVRDAGLFNPLLQVVDVLVDVLVDVGVDLLQVRWNLGKIWLNFRVARRPDTERGPIGSRCLRSGGRTAGARGCEQAGDEKREQSDEVEHQHPPGRKCRCHLLTACRIEELDN